MEHDAAEVSRRKSLKGRSARLVWSAVLVGFCVLTVLAAPIAVESLLRAAAPLESGEVTVAVTGRLSGDGYEILPSAVAETDGAEYISGVNMRILRTGDDATMPVISIVVGVGGTRCTSVPDETWISNWDSEAQNALLYVSCDPFVELKDFRRVGEVIVDRGE